jgi:hypothetical protein
VLQQLTSQVRGTVSGIDLAPQFQGFAFGALVLLLVDTLLASRPQWRRSARVAPMAAATTVAATLVVGACGRSAPPAAQVSTSPPDTIHIALYNKGTTLLTHDSLERARPLLKAAQASSDSIVQFRAAYNGGWDHLITGLRTLTALTRGGPTADSLLSVITRNATSLMAEDDDSAEVLPIGKRPDEHPVASPQVQRTLARTYIAAHIDSALMQYRTALLRHPSDVDAKWNYEIAARMSETVGSGKKTGKNKKKENNKKGNNKKSNKKKEEDKKQKQKVDKKKGDKKDGGRKLGKTSQTPPVEQLRLPPEQAKQLLNAVGQHEQKAIKAVPVPAVPPTHGKDW